MSSEQDKLLIDKTVAALDESADQLDYRSQLQLKRAREAALAALDEPAKAPAKRGWLWLTAVPAALAVVMLLPLAHKNPVSSTSPESLAMLQDFEIMVAGEDVEMLEDMEFYQWLAEQERLEEV